MKDFISFLVNYLIDLVKKKKQNPKPKSTLAFTSTWSLVQIASWLASPFIMIGIAQLVEAVEPLLIWKNKIIEYMC